MKPLFSVKIGSQTSRRQDPSYPLKGLSKRSSLRNPTVWNRLPNVIVSKFLPVFGFLLSAAWKTNPYGNCDSYMRSAFDDLLKLQILCWSSYITFIFFSPTPLVFPALTKRIFAKVFQLAANCNHPKIHPKKRNRKVKGKSPVIFGYSIYFRIM